MSMGHLERVLAVLNNKEPDRVPIDFGENPVTIHHIALRNLLEFMGWEINAPIVCTDKRWGFARVPESLLKHFRVDCRRITLNPPGLEEVRYVSEDVYVDEFGITFRRCGYYYDMVEELKPLYNAKKRSDVESYRPPKPHEGRLHGLRKRAEMYEEEGYAVILNAFSGGIFELAQWLHGISNTLKNMILNPELMDAIFDLTLEIHKSFWDCMLNEVGDHIHIVSYTDDYGTQSGLQVSLNAWEKFIFPRLKELISFIKKRTKAKVMLHSDGAVRPIIGRLIEAGIDILNPIQARAKGMSRRELRTEFRGKIIFHAGVDTQYIMPKGTVDDVKNEVKDVIDSFFPGYIFYFDQNIQPDVPPQNILAGFITALTYVPK